MWRHGSRSRLEMCWREADGKVVAGEVQPLVFLHPSSLFNFYSFFTSFVSFFFSCCLAVPCCVPFSLPLLDHFIFLLCRNKGGLVNTRMVDFRLTPTTPRCSAQRGWDKERRRCWMLTRTLPTQRGLNLFGSARAKNKTTPPLQVLAAHAWNSQTL
jgi:hypothetical protein